MSIRRLFLLFVIQISILLSVSQVVLAGGGNLVSVTASCSGDNVVIDITATAIYWGATVVWSGTSSGSFGGIGSSTSATGTYEILGPGTFSITVSDNNYPSTKFDLGTIACPETTVPVTVERPNDLIEMCDDGRTNTNLCEPLAIYPVETDDGVGMVIYRIPRDSADIGELEVYIPAEDLDSLPDNVDEACTIAASEDGLVVVYLLDTGEIQVNTGPDEENKFFVFRYENFPEVPEVETYFGEDTPAILPSCWQATEVSHSVTSITAF